MSEFIDLLKAKCMAFSKGTETTNEYSINSSYSKQINICKAIAIILVVFLHSYRTNINFLRGSMLLQIPQWFEFMQYSISNIVSRSAVPAFFVISAILLYKKTFNYRENLKKKVKTILIPYLIFNTLAIMSYFILQNVPACSSFFSKPENIIAHWSLFDWLNAYIGYRDYYPLLYPLWFLRNLFLLNIFAPVVNYFIKKHSILFIIFTAFLYLLFHNLLMTTVFYWSIGCFIANKNIYFKNYEKSNILVLLLYLILVFLDFMTQSNYYHSLLHSTTLIVGTFIIFHILPNMIMQIKKENIFLFISKFSFFIYLFHEMNLTYLRKLCAAILPNTLHFIIIEYFVCPIAIVIYCIILGLIISKYYPSLYAILTGGRMSKKTPVKDKSM